MRAPCGSGRWTRPCATDSSTASRTQLGAPEWDPALLDIFAMPAEALPAIMHTAGDLGTLRHHSRPVELPLRARFIDQRAALAGAGAWSRKG
jgi:glycerol kinase